MELVKKKYKKAKIKEKISDFVFKKYGVDLSGNKKYLIEKFIVEINKKKLIKNINEYFLTVQIIADADCLFNKDDMILIYSILDDLMQNPNKDITSFCSKISTDAQIKIKEIQDKLKNNKYKSFNNNTKVEEIDQELIEGADFSNIDEIYYPELSDINFNEYNTATKIIPKKEKIIFSIENLDKNTAKQLIEDEIAKNYGLLDDFDEALSLEGKEGNEIISVIINNKENKKIFSSNSIINVDDFIDEIYNYIIKHDYHAQLKMPNI